MVVVVVEEEEEEEEDGEMANICTPAFSFGSKENRSSVRYLKELLCAEAGANVTLRARMNYLITLSAPVVADQ